LPIATDYPQQWCWGDTGTCYVFLDVAGLRVQGDGQSSPSWNLINRLLNNAA
jgi:hypothetical protein